MSLIEAASLSVTSSATPAAARPRLVSLDVFRGITIAFMLLVNNPGDWTHLYWPLKHADWHGCTPTDLVFPFFLFIVGVAIPFSQAKRAAIESRLDQFVHIVTRGLSLFLLGAILNAIPSRAPAAAPGFALVAFRIITYAFLIISVIALLVPWRNRRIALLAPPIVAILFVLLAVAIHFINRHALDSGLPADYEFGGGLLLPYKMRIPGVLQRIAVCYVVAASIALVTGWRTVLLATIVFLAAYSTLMLKAPYPSLENPANRVIGKLDKTDNLARHIDTKVLRGHAYPSYPDPEGILSTLPAISTVLLGILAGFWLRTSGSPERRCAGLFALGVAVTSAGYILAHELMPLNKQIWTPSYAVFTAGLAMLGLGLCFWLVDILGWRRAAMPFTIYGMNAIAAFVLAGIVGRLTLLIKLPGSDSKPIALKTFLVNHLSDGLGHLAGADSFWSNAYNISLAYAVCFVVVFLLLMSILYALKIFVKV